ncbi:MAG: glycosyltransferase family 4 protein [Desulfovibrio sp.]|jgi:glycosyltransferase involved in cell wall biosynthesis
MTTFLSCRLDAPYLVHLEDNEELIYRTHVRPKKYTGIQGVLRRFLLSRSSFIHPERYRNFLARSAAVTCITESLQEFVPQGVPSLTFWPACEPGFLDLPLEPDQQVRRELGISDNSCVLTYTGGVHAANREEVQTLYRAVAELNRRGRSVHLIRCGNAPPSLNHDALNSRDLVTELGELPPDRLMRYIAAADVLVQPGRPDPFNDYRFPSKIPMFLASGRPVILPATNIGLHLTHGENCLLLRQGTLVELVEALERLLADKDLRRGIGQGGRRFVRENLSWDKAGRQVLALYERCLVNEEKR